MKGFTFGFCILFLTMAVGPAVAGKAARDIPITQEISDYDANSVPFYIQSDGLGDYKDKSTIGTKVKVGDISVLMANVCGNLPNGDRLLETVDLGVRQVTVRLDSTNAIQAGDPNYLVPAQLQGTIVSPVRMMNKCTCETGQSMYAMAAGTTIFCPMHLRLEPLGYRLDMGTTGENETEKVRISCKASDSAGCKDWSIDPISDSDYTTNPGRTRARLVNLGNGQNMGNFYMTFHIQVTRP